MTAEVRALLKSRDSGFRAGDKAALRTARAKLSRAIREAKHTHTQRIHGHFQDSRDSRHMWQGIQVITNHKTTPSACDSDASLPDALNDFYARFKAQNNVAARKIILLLTTSSAFNTIIPQHLIEKLSLLDLNTSLCNWILNFLTGRPQSVRIGNSFSSTSPLLFTLLTHDCAAMHSSNHIKFAEDMTVMGLISKNGESAYREEVQRLTARCKANSLSLNVDKTKEMVVDFRRAQSDHSPLFIDESPVEIKFLGVHLAENFTWSLNTTSITKKAQQCLYFLRRLRKAHLPPPILTMFYRGTIESILSSCITALFGNCIISDRKTLQRIVRTAEKISLSPPSITDMYTTRCIRKANSTVDDPTHPSHTLFTLLPSGKSHNSFHSSGQAFHKVLESFCPFIQYSICDILLLDKSDLSIPESLTDLSTLCAKDLKNGLLFCPPVAEDCQCMYADPCSFFSRDSNISIPELIQDHSIYTVALAC
ncbi:hypothetical protein QTP70_000387 [Hemibagrus guttatus]|uniref:Reverse transcriptase domain-containing protein n=1 Tax=Hemibagrus guttatus TaxID=175788 RepID=A0AAE0Q012_9TELE|nr:hypothetical protein QTP70_000387 [Hemibagrus guttatus]